MSSRPTVYAWITGERTNVGDSLLRRPYIAALSLIGPLHLWINKSTPDFLTNLALPTETDLHRRFASWYVRLLASAVRRRTVLVLNAGEFRVRPSGAALLALLLIAAQLVRLRGGATIWVGVSVPQSERKLLSIPYRWAGRNLDYVQWREPRSVQTSARRAVGPDWGFAEGSPTANWDDALRPLCAFVLRGDRALPSDEWFRWARDLCADLGLRPVVVVQVRQDTDRAHEVAAVLEAQVIEWDPASDHVSQELRIREVYRESLLVVGDRLHGLVIGATEGAVPLGWVESSRGKIDTHFTAVGLAYPGASEGRTAAELRRVTTSDITNWRDELVSAIEEARRSIRHTQRALSSLATAQSPAELAPLRRP
ncbi:hypothetical protein ACFXQA_14790 [Microbacterium sp. P07]|uniref:hypothetical protein n=1 Tax=Microbacterium sp. P07 TaxID=3366952 RepID=UPI0037472328